MALETRENTPEKKIPQFKRIITIKSNKIKKLLEEENAETPLELTGTAEEIFEKTRKEILDTIWQIENLWGDISKVEVRKISKVGPFMKKQRKASLKDPRIKKRLAYLDNLHQESEDRKEIKPGALNAEFQKKIKKYLI